MSTKTTFKRVALVAVAALSLGVISVAPSSAVPAITTTVAYDTATSTAIVGGQVTVSVRTDSTATSTRATVVSSGVGSVVSAISSATGGETSTVTGTPTSGTFYIDNISPRSAFTNVVVSSAVAGTQTLTVTPLNSSGTPGTAVTKTITWVTSTTLDVNATKSTSVINAYAANLGAAFTADAALTVAAGTTPAQVAAVKVTLLDANGLAVNGKTLAATVSGPGLLQIDSGDETVTATAAARAVSAVISDNVAYIGVFNDGTAGVSTITISVGTTVIATESIAFSGSAVKYEIKSIRGVMAIGTNGTADSATTGISVKVTDSAGNAVAGHPVFVKHADATIATVTTSSQNSGSSTASPAGMAYFAVVGVKSGSTTIQACNTSACTAATITASTTVNVAKTEAATVTAAFDKSSYSPGEKMTLNIVAKDADGAAIADANAGTYTMTANLGTTSTLPTAAAFVGGTQAVTVFAPVSSGDFTVSIKLLAGSAWATALDDTTISATANVINAGADAATDAANEATDAANAATDAALASADAADAATAAAQDASDAVAALSTRVSELIKDLRKQIRELTKLVQRLL